MLTGLDQGLQSLSLLCLGKSLSTYNVENFVSLINAIFMNVSSFL